MSSSAQPDDSVTITWPELVRFVRQLGHDIRNTLNAAELQSAYLAELANTDELKNEVQRLRAMISETGVSLQRLSAAFAQINPTKISYSAGDFMDDLKKKVASQFPDDANKIKWEVDVAAAQLEIDPQLMQQALLELFTNAFQHERNVKSLTVRASVNGGRFVFELREPKTKFDEATENWARSPLRKVGQGHYGLGLNQSRRIIEGHSGELSAAFDRSNSTLATRVTLPLSGKTRST
jgi:K+-sensing histidine kinase KdpD